MSASGEYLGGGSLTEENLREVYETRIRNSRSRGRDGLTASNLDEIAVNELIVSAASAIRENRYRFSPYREVLKLKSAKKYPRVISIPTVRDRLVLAVLAQALRAAIPEVTFPRPQPLISAIRGAVNSGIYRDFVRLDIMTFYPSLSHESVTQALESRSIDPRIVRLVLSAIENPTLADGHVDFVPKSISRGVPAGTAIANVLGEIALINVDNAIRSEFPIAYFRYVDDIVILSPYGLRNKLRNKVRDELAQIGLQSHPKESKDKSASGIVGRDAFEYLGYTFERGGVTVHKSRHSRLITNLARPITVLRRAIDEGHPDLPRAISRAQWWLDFRITGCISESTRRGWLPYYSQIDQMSLLHHLDDVVSRLITRLPRAHRFVAKSFVRTYTLTRDPDRDKHGYIPDFDSLTVGQMKVVLENASDFRSIPNDEAGIRRLFRRFISFAVKELESDVGSVS